MGPKLLNLNEPPKEGGTVCHLMLRKDQKLICRAQCNNLPIEVSPNWNISDIKPATTYSLCGLPRFFLYPAFENIHQQKEWGAFLGFLKKYNRVATVSFETCNFYILPPDASLDLLAVSLQLKEGGCFDKNNEENILEDDGPAEQEAESSTPKANACGSTPSNLGATNACFSDLASSHRPHDCHQENTWYLIEDVAESEDANVRGSSISTGLNVCKTKHSVDIKPMKYSEDVKSPLTVADRFVQVLDNLPLPKNYVKTDPSYLRTLSQTHSGWIFGAVAELVDNSRDAGANRLNISVDSLYSKSLRRRIPVLSVIDDGHGMSHNDIVRMLSFGHKQPTKDDVDRIGRFGIGFKTGAMRLGEDTLILTQTHKSRSVALLSQSYNKDKDNLEIPIISYQRQGSFMEIDLRIHSQALADYHLNAIKEHSPFNEYIIGEKLGLFSKCKSGTGTQIYIWNLDQWGTDYSLGWVVPKVASNSCGPREGDIRIRSRRIRSRPGQISQKVPLDYSLRSYMEVIFLDPRMKIYVQGSLIKSRPLARTLNKTVVVKGDIMGKSVELTLGFSQQEWELVNCGMFLYWHGRLIEAYKRVGGMVHNADMGRGIIGVIDVTELMKGRDDRVLVLNNKQGFQDCELYSRLEEWLGQRADAYWDDNFDNLNLRKGENNNYKPDHEWVQCDKCRKWRILNTGFDSENLPKQWFCYMPPFNGKCEMPEQIVEQGVITVGAKRSGCQLKQDNVQTEQAAKRSKTHISCKGPSSTTIREEEEPPMQHLKRLRSGAARSCKKT